MRALEGAGLCVFALVWGLLCLCCVLEALQATSTNEFVIDLWVCEPAPVCFSGAGLGLLPFSVSPVTPTASTNCDTGTHSLLNELYLCLIALCVLKKIFDTYLFQSCRYFLLVWVTWLSVWDIWPVIESHYLPCCFKPLHYFLFFLWKTKFVWNNVHTNAMLPTLYHWATGSLYGRTMAEL